jgi:hypothetical protein
LREFVSLGLLGLSLLLTACGNHSRANGKQVIVIGVDGMDPGFVERHWTDLPHLARMRSRGSFTRLATTTPPQSPTAWSTFITGLDPAEHGIFDFVHRDPATMQPFLSMSETKDGRFRIPLGPWQLPLSRSQVESVLADTGRSWNSRHDRPHAGELPACRIRRGSGGHGHTRPAGFTRNVQLLFRRPGRKTASG